jgi:hypothetical protein
LDIWATGLGGGDDPILAAARPDPLLLNVILDRIRIDPERTVALEAIEDLEVPSTDEAVSPWVVYLEVQLFEIAGLQPSTHASLQNDPLIRQLLRAETTQRTMVLIDVSSLSVTYVTAYA